jgi:hypothetical protein
MGRAQFRGYSSCLIVNPSSARELPGEGIRIPFDAEILDTCSFLEFYVGQVMMAANACLQPALEEKSTSRRFRSRRVVKGAADLSGFSRNSERSSL